MSIAYFTVPPKEGDDANAVWCHLPGRRFVTTRRDRPDCLRVYLGVGGDHPELNEVHRHGTVREQKEAWARLYSHDMDGTWQMPRFLDGLLNSPLADDFYAQELAEVKIDNWSRGRVVLVGDAAYCASPLSGMGTSLAFVGAYVLAGEIAKACGRGAQGGATDPWENLPSALAAYETTLRPFIKAVQANDVKSQVKWLLPETAWAIYFLHWAAWAFTTFRLDRLMSLIVSQEGVAWKLPDYSHVLREKNEDEA
ncbi:hypothetical protein BT67DRAFT_444050 [Trichocladium antarcticum]|uniref:FAD-binding domain-containing protein n=1 Tax=Trichocladium antarcticum TaxID=1450529 RepID=A0AAN6UGF2_9PEZI|nr:hypothetical protein BT67DRAFT_444050 [Trichocladium antarcticum]